MAEATSPTSPAICLNLMSGSSPIPDALGGTEYTVSSGAGDLQAYINGTGVGSGKGALNADGSHKGNTYLVPAGVTYTNVILPQTTGAGYTCIRSNSSSLPNGTIGSASNRVGPSNVSQMFTVNGTGNGTVPGWDVPTGSNGWRVIGMQSIHDSGTFQYTQVQVRGNRCCFERCYTIPHAQASDAFRGIFMEGASDLQIWDSWMEGRAVQGDAQGFWCRTFVNVPARLHIENCEIRGSGENLMLGDATSLFATQDVTIKRNHLFKPLEWMKFLPNTSTPNPAFVMPPNAVNTNGYSIKNLFEQKYAARVLFEGNVLENCWVGNQNGDAIVVNTGNRAVGAGNAYSGPNDDVEVLDVMFRSNKIIYVDLMFTINWVGPRDIHIPRRLAFMNNLGLQVRTGMGLIAHWNQEVRIEHNTAVPCDGSFYETYAGGLYLNRSNDATNTDPFENFTFKNNVLGWAQNANGIKYIPETGAIDLNFTDTTRAANFSSTTWSNNAQFGGTLPTMTSITRYATSAAAGIDTSTGVLSGGSALIGAGSDAADIGVNFTTLQAAIDGVEGAAQAPVANWSGTQTPGSFQVSFTDLSSNTPTSWVWSGTDGFSSTQQNPTFTFTSAGTKTVTLTATNATGSDDFTSDIQVTAIGGWTFRSSSSTTAGAGVSSIAYSPATVVAGDLIVVTLNRSDPTSIDSVTDTMGNTYSAVSASVSVPGLSTSLSRTFWAVSSLSATSPTVTANFTGTTASFSRMFCSVFIPLGTVTLIGSNTGTGTSVLSPMNSGSVAATSNDNLLLYGVNDFNTTVPTDPSGWTGLDASKRLIAYDTELRGTYSYQPSYAGSQSWVAQIVVFDATATSSVTLSATTKSYTSTYTAYDVSLVAFTAETLTAVSKPFFITPYSAQLSAVGATSSIYLIRVFEFVPGLRASAVIRAQVPVANTSYYVDSTYNSIHPFTTVEERDALRAGEIVEKLVAFPPKTMTTDALFQSAAITAQQAYQAEISAVATSDFDGTRGVEETYDGTTWS